MRTSLMRLALAATALLLGVGPGWADDQDGSDLKLMAAAAYTLAATAQVGGQIEVQSSNSALFHPYGFKAWKVDDCTYAYSPTSDPNGRVYKILFRNLTGQFEQQGSTLVFLGTGIKPAVCVRDGTMSGCLQNLVMGGVYNPSATINNALYPLQHGCAPKVEDMPGNRDPHE